MVRFPKVLVIVLVVGGLLALATPASAAETKVTIKSVDSDKREIVCKDKDGKEWTFMMEKSGKVQLADKEGKLNELKAGDEVTVTYDKEGDKLIAREIRREQK